MAETPKAQKKECRFATRYPVMMGAAIPESWLEKLMIPPTLPTLLRGAIREGIDHPTGEAAERPPMEMLIQIRAVTGLWVFAAPRMPRPKAVPPMSMVLRTRLGL